MKINLQYSESCQGWSNDIDAMWDVDQSSYGILQGRPGLDAGDVNVEDEDVEQHGEDREHCPWPEGRPHPPGLPWPSRFVRVHAVL